MPDACPDCGKMVPVDADSCPHCAAEIRPGAPLVAPSVGDLGASPSPIAPSGRAEGPVVPEGPIALEFETGASRYSGHQSLLRFRLVSGTQEAQDVTLVAIIEGDPDVVAQPAGEVEQCDSLAGRGDYGILAFPFVAHVPGRRRFARLRLAVARSGETKVYEARDKGLQITVLDPALRPTQENIVIGGGIHAEKYGSDGSFSVNVGGKGQGTTWMPVRLREVEVIDEWDGSPATIAVRLPNGVSMDFVHVRPGEFTMGSEEDEGREDETPARRVRLTRGFYLGACPVTQAQYEALTEENPSGFAGPENPVENVSWEAAREYCRKLATHLRRSPEAVGTDAVAVQDVALPTEAEWEYACRAGSDTAYAFGDDRADLPDYGWFDRTAKRTTHPVAELKPNAWGLFDMHGNVYEWCADLYADACDPADTVDPTGPAEGDHRVLRGGSWSAYAKRCRSAARHAAAPSDATPNYGFRVALWVKEA